MAKTKKCSYCNELKPTTDFSRNSKSKDLLQHRCKKCNKLYNDVNNHKVEVTEKRIQYNKKYFKADKDGLIYTITNPIGEVYVGSTKLLPNIRFSHHRHDFSSVNGKFPLLHSSFEKWGIDAHEFKVIQNHGEIPTIELREIESNMIKAYKLNGKSLNVKD